MARTSIVSRLAKHGFKLQGTGGNCTAFVRREDGCEVEELITVAGGFLAPESLDDAVEVSMWEYESEDQRDYADGMDGITLRDVLAALDNPSDEYCLLLLRLQNDFHHVTR